jgi:hypothetical protein
MIGFVHYAKHGEPVYGGSVGAILLGKDIGTYLYFDQNLVGLSDTSGLDLCGGLCIWCHFSDEHTKQINSTIRSSGHDVISLPETAGLYVNENRKWPWGKALSVTGQRVEKRLYPDIVMSGNCDADGLAATIKNVRGKRTLKVDES